MVRAVIFDLDGVLVTTDDCHFQAWKQMAEENGIPFSRQDNERLRGVSRMASLDIVLEKAKRHYSEAEKLALAMRKNDLYVDLISALTQDAVLPGAIETVRALKQDKMKVAIGSSSKNTRTILKRLDMADLFDAVADGNQISNSKPDPEVFLLAASKLAILPEYCIVVEDADAGVEAALRGGMRVLGVGSASRNPSATWRAQTLDDIDLAALVRDENNR